ncbi:MAG: ComEC/Rec2 family competence protein [Candidatus Pacebacteria bacterium]|nr:ComEC/Rec2 family competence protein [Candidatus Paceibacterota bacterium]MBP9700946.1 ComEC/Rec2 family competence protein [Candidatus Paceibacterota bacterium]
MVELVALMLTIGAVMYHSFYTGIETVVYVGILVALSCALFFRTVRGICFGLILGATLILGALALWRIDEPVVGEVYGNRAFDAKVVSVDRRLDRTLLVVRDVMFDERLQVSVTGVVELLPGDTVTVRGTVAPPQDFVTDSGRIFGYQAYLASKGIVGLVNNPTVVLVDEGAWSLSRIATIIRYRVADIFAQHISFPFDGVIAGMLVGYQGGLPQSVQDLFRDTGVLHVLVLSGYNITLLAGFLGLLLRALPFRIRTILTVIAILMLVLVSGAGVASVRAGIMGSIALFAGLSIRTYQPIRALFVAYILFFFISPHTVFADPGFHLSFLATLFMVAVLPRVEQLFSFIPKTTHVDLRELIMMAVSIPIFMLPYTMYFSGSFPLASPLANMVLALVTPVAMIAGIIIVACAWVVPLAGLVGTITSLGGRLLLWLLKLSARLPQWQTPALAWWGVVMIYAGILGTLFRKDIATFVMQRYRMLRQRTN